MKPLPKKILVFGATGVIGKYIITALVENKDTFDAIGVFTSPETLQNKQKEIDSLKSEGVKIIIGSVQSESDVKRAYEGTSSLHDLIFGRHI